MGRYTVEAFCKFALCSLRSQSIYFSDFNSKIYDGKPLVQEANKKKDFEEFSQKLCAILNNSPIALPNLENLIDDMRKFEGENNEDKYSEGGSDSEFSEEDVEGVEKRVLLQSMLNYSQNYTNQNLVVPNFTKRIKKEFTRINKKKKKNELEEFTKNKEFKKRFEKLEFFSPFESSELQTALTKGKEAAYDKPGYSKTPDRRQTKTLLDGNITTKRSIRRDLTMPNLQQSSNVLGQSIANQTNLKRSIFDSSDGKGRPVASIVPSELTRTKLSISRTGISSNDRALELRRQVDGEYDRGNTGCYYPSIEPLPSNSKDDRKIVKACAVPVMNDRLVGELLSRDMQSMKAAYLNDIENQKRIIAKTLSVKKNPEVVTMSIQTLELNVTPQIQKNTAINHVSKGPRFHHFPVAKYYMNLK
jgi:hypothetical protein